MMSSDGLDYNLDDFNINQDWFSDFKSTTPEPNEGDLSLNVPLNDEQNALYHHSMQPPPESYGVELSGRIPSSQVSEFAAINEPSPYQQQQLQSTPLQQPQMQQSQGQPQFETLQRLQPYEIGQPGSSGMSESQMNLSQASTSSQIPPSTMHQSMDQQQQFSYIPYEQHSQYVNCIPTSSQGISYEMSQPVQQTSLQQMHPPQDQPPGPQQPNIQYEWMPSSQYQPRQTQQQNGPITYAVMSSASTSGLHQQPQTSSHVQMRPQTQVMDSGLYLQQAQPTYVQDGDGQVQMLTQMPIQQPIQQQPPRQEPLQMVHHQVPDLAQQRPNDSISYQSQPQMIYQQNGGVQQISAQMPVNSQSIQIIDGCQYISQSAIDPSSSQPQYQTVQVLSSGPIANQPAPQMPQSQSQPLMQPQQVLQQPRMQIQQPVSQPQSVPAQSVAQPPQPTPTTSTPAPVPAKKKHPSKQNGKKKPAVGDIKVIEQKVQEQGKLEVKVSEETGVEIAKLSARMMEIEMLERQNPKSSGALASEKKEIEARLLALFLGQQAPAAPPPMIESTPAPPPAASTAPKRSSSSSKSRPKKTVAQLKQEAAAMAAVHESQHHSQPPAFVQQTPMQPPLDHRSATPQATPKPSARKRPPTKAQIAQQQAQLQAQQQAQQQAQSQAMQPPPMDLNHMTYTSMGQPQVIYHQHMTTPSTSSGQPSQISVQYTNSLSSLSKFPPGEVISLPPGATIPGLPFTPTPGQRIYIVSNTAKSEPFEPIQTPPATSTGVKQEAKPPPKRKRPPPKPKPPKNPPQLSTSTAPKFAMIPPAELAKKIAEKKDERNSNRSRAVEALSVHEGKEESHGNEDTEYSVQGIANQLRRFVNSSDVLAQRMDEYQVRESLAKLGSPKKCQIHYDYRDFDPSVYMENIEEALAMKSPHECSRRTSIDMDSTYDYYVLMMGPESMSYKENAANTMGNAVSEESVFPMTSPLGLSSYKMEEQFMAIGSENATVISTDIQIDESFAETSLHHFGDEPLSPAFQSSPTTMIRKERSPIKPLVQDLELERLAKPPFTSLSSSDKTTRIAGSSFESPIKPHEQISWPKSPSISEDIPLESPINQHEPCPPSPLKMPIRETLDEKEFVQEEIAEPTQPPPPLMMNGFHPKELQEITPTKLRIRKDVIDEISPTNKEILDESKEARRKRKEKKRQEKKAKHAMLEAEKTTYENEEKLVPMIKFKLVEQKLVEEHQLLSRRSSCDDINSVGSAKEKAVVQRVCYGMEVSDEDDDDTKKPSTSDAPMLPIKLKILKSALHKENEPEMSSDERKELRKKEKKKGKEKRDKKKHKHREKENRQILDDSLEVKMDHNGGIHASPVKSDITVPKIVIRIGKNSAPPPDMQPTEELKQRLKISLPAPQILPDEIKPKVEEEEITIEPNSHKRKHHRSKEDKAEKKRKKREKLLREIESRMLAENAEPKMFPKLKIKFGEPKKPQIEQMSTNEPPVHNGTPTNHQPISGNHQQSPMNVPPPVFTPPPTNSSSINSPPSDITSERNNSTPVNILELRPRVQFSPCSDDSDDERRRHQWTNQVLSKLGRK